MMTLIIFLKLTKMITQPILPLHKSLGYHLLPNLTLYTDTGAVNTLGYNTSTHVVSAENSCQNNGGSNITSTFYIGWHLLDASFNIVQFLTSNSITGLNSSSFVNRSMSVDLDNYCIPTGTYYVNAWFDYTNLVTESNESDNSGISFPQFSIKIT